MVMPGMIVLASQECMELILFRLVYVVYMFINHNHRKKLAGKLLVWRLDASTRFSIPNILLLIMSLDCDIFSRSNTLAKLN